jgi:GNAT superfamily N-acetyltransferase
MLRGSLETVLPIFSSEPRNRSRPNPPKEGKNMNFSICSLPIEAALRWERNLGVVGILGSHRPDGAIAALAPDGKIVGAATVSGWWLSGVVVHPDYRRHGVGRALFLRAFEIARERGHDPIRVEVCGIDGRNLISSLPIEVQRHLWEREE